MDNNIPVTPSVPEESVVIPNISGSPTIPNDTPGEKPKKPTAKIIATLFGVLVLLGAVGAGLVLVSQRQLINQKAATPAECQAQGQIFCAGCINACRTYAHTCNQWIDLECNQPTCGGDGTFPSNGQSCCPGLILYPNGRCGVAPDATSTPAPPPPTSNPTPTGNTGGGCTQTGSSITCPVNGTTYHLITCNDPTNTSSSYPGCATNANCSTQNWSGGTVTVSAPACGSTQIDVQELGGGVCAGAGSACTSTPPPTTPPTSTPTPTPTPLVSAQCTNLKAYSTSWVLLTATDLTNLKTGDRVRFAVTGTTTGTFDKARFTVNSETVKESALKKPGDNSTYYYEYTIPAGALNFTVKSELHSVDLNQWF